MPWRHFSSPVEQWADMPSFLIGEYAFMVFAAIALFHAIQSGRDHLLIWIGAIIAGTCNDLIFMALPLVDNFWQAQATVMITWRLPLYIPCVYVCFMYYPTVAVRRLGLDPWATAVATGLLAMVFYAPYDIVGAKFLWWTWHDTDPPIDARLLGAPVPSSLWILTFVATFSWLIDRAIRPDPEVPAKRFALGLAMVAGLTTILMMVQMTILQQLDGGTPRYVAFAGGIVIYLGVLVWRGREREYVPPTPHDRLLYGTVLVYFALFPLLMASFDPQTHRSTGVHQPAGECYVEEKDVTGQTRHKYLCVTDYEEDYTFECVDSPPAAEDGPTQWYTVCGKAHTRFGAHLGGVVGLGALGILLFSLLIGPLRRRE